MDWPSYYMNIAYAVAKKSNCIKRAVGCIIVSMENRIISTGYNGTPTGMLNCCEGGCTRCKFSNKDEYCNCLHAEENALLNIEYTKALHSTLYTTVFPCRLCALKIIQCGIKKVVFNEDYKKDDECIKLLKMANVKTVKCRDGDFLESIKILTI